VTDGCGVGSLKNAWRRLPGIWHGARTKARPYLQRARRALTSRTARNVCIGAGICAVAVTTAVVFPPAPAAASAVGQANFLAAKLVLGGGLGAFTVPHVVERVFGPAPPPRN
jgi:hypothetical protein